MKITVSHKLLASAFGLAASVAPTRSAKEVLNHVKIIADADQVWLIATDLESGLRIPVSGAEILTQGSALLSTARMGAILREWSEDYITIEVDGYSVLVTGVYSRFTLPTANPMEYPSINTPPEKEGYTTLPARGLAEAIKRTVFACDIDSTRFALGGVLMLMDGADSSVVGTDGRRLACTTMAGKTTGKVGDGGPIVPMKSANVLMRMLDGAESVKATFGFSECWFETDRGTFWCRLLEGRFPAWKQVIPKFDDWTVDAMVPVGPFASLIRQAAIVADAESRGVNFTFTGGTLRAGAQVADLGQSQVDMPIAYEGEKLTVKLDFRFLGDFLRVLDAGSMFRLRIKNSNMPTLMSTADGYSYVVMPMSMA